MDACLLFLLCLYVHIKIISGLIHHGNGEYICSSSGNCVNQNLYCTDDVSNCFVSCYDTGSCQGLVIYSSSVRTNVICGNSDACKNTKVYCGSILTDIVGNNDPNVPSLIHFINNVFNTCNYLCIQNEGCDGVTMRCSGVIIDGCGINANGDRSVSNSVLYCESTSGLCGYSCDGIISCQDGNTLYCNVGGNGCDCYGNQDSCSNYVNILTSNPTGMLFMWLINIKYVNAHYIIIYIVRPTLRPTERPTERPTVTYTPSNTPTSTPTKSPIIPSLFPTNLPSNSPTLLPTLYPTGIPSQTPSISPTFLTSIYPTKTPSETLIENPTHSPAHSPTHTPSSYPSNIPTLFPTVYPSNQPSKFPTNIPTISPFSTINSTQSEDREIYIKIISLQNYGLLFVLSGSLLFIITCIIWIICIYKHFKSKVPNPNSISNAKPETPSLKMRVNTLSFINTTPIIPKKVIHDNKSSTYDEEEGIPNELSSNIIHPSLNFNVSSTDSTQINNDMLIANEIASNEMDKQSITKGIPIQSTQQNMNNNVKPLSIETKWVPFKNNKNSNPIMNDKKSTIHI